LKRFVVIEADDWWNSLEEGLIDIYIRLGVDGIVSQVQKFYNSGLLVSFIKEACSSELFFD